MDVNDIVKAAPHVQNIVALIVGGIPIGEIAKSILVPSAAVLGKRMADRVDRLFEKTGEMVIDAGITPQQVPDKLMIEIVRGASVEEDESIHSMFAALLANAASPEHSSRVQPSFIAILKQMSPDEANLLQWFKGFDRHEFSIIQSVVNEYMSAIGLRSTEKNAATVQRCFDALESFRLIRRDYYSLDSAGLMAPSFSEPLPSLPIMTDRGRAFIEACQPPQRGSE